MKRHEMIYSPAMGRKMHVWCYGHYGFPVLVFPSAAGFAHEWDSHSMVSTLSHFIGSGKIKLYCPESNISQSWTKKDGDPIDRINKHKAYEEFIMNTLVPWIYKDCHANQIPIATAGCSLGGFYAANFALKYSERFNYALCMSGRYETTQFLDGFSNTDVYFNNPIAYVANLRGEGLEHVRKNTHISLVCGQGAFEEGCIEETIMLGKILKNKGIPSVCDIWGKESRHDWAWWKRQAVSHLNDRFG